MLINKIPAKFKQKILTFCCFILIWSSLFCSVNRLIFSYYLSKSDESCIFTLDFWLYKNAYYSYIKI